VLSALVIIPHVLDPYRARAETPVGHAVQAAKIGFTRTSDLDFDAARSVGNQLVGVQFLKTWNCLGKPVETCTILDGTSSHILVIGDSTAWMMFPTFAAIAQKEGLTLSTAAVAGCPWQRNLYLSNDRVAVLRDHRKKCEAMKRDLYERVIPRLKPDLIVAVSNDYIDGNVSRFAVVEDQNNRPLHSDSTKQLQNQAAVDTRHSLTLLEASGAKVLIVEPVPITTPDRDPYTCLTKSTLIEECRFVTDAQPTAQELMYRADAGKRVSVANFDKLMCPFLPICDPVIGGRIVRFDNQHITASYALSIAGDVTTFLQDEGLIPR
jgi:hypothetical protein